MRMAARSGGVGERMDATRHRSKQQLTSFEMRGGQPSAKSPAFTSMTDMLGQP